MELNPRHPATRAAREQWHKITAILMKKMNLTHVVITLQDIEALSADGEVNIALQELTDGIHLRLVDNATAERMVREHGGDVKPTDN